MQGRNEFTRNYVFSRFVQLFNYQDPCGWRIRDSNPRPQACKARALPAELIPQLPKTSRRAARPQESVSQDRIASTSYGIDQSLPARGQEVSRKEVIQPQVPLRLPCYDLVPITGLIFGACLAAPTTSDAPRFGGLTGGVYKAQEHIHRGSADPRLLAIPASCGRVAARNPNWGPVFAIGSALRHRDALSGPL